MEATQNDAKELFRKCGACSHTFAYIINREYGNHDPIYEKALDTLAGGIFREGHQCGMLWGAVLATGSEASRRSDQPNEARTMALTAAKELVASFQDQERAIECHQITGIRMNRLLGLLELMAKTMLKGMNNSQCFVMAEKWAPKAIEASKSGLDVEIDGVPPAYNCASMLAEKLGMTTEEANMVAGFAGGLG
jgi:hypothetical protein